MQYLKYVLPFSPRSNYVSILPIGDLHIGNPYANLARAETFRDYVLETPNVFTLDMGDDCDVTTRQSLGNIYEQTMSPYFQAQESVKFWQPVAKANKLLCCLDDNHSFRVRAESDWRIVPDMCKKLGVPYGGWGVYLDIFVGPYRYGIYAVHGKRSATTDAAALNHAVRMNQRCIADVYLRAHHHRKIVHQDEIKRLVDDKLMECKRTYCVTGSLLEWDNSYAEQSEYNITVKGCIKLKLFTHHWDVHASL